MLKVSLYQIIINTGDGCNSIQYTTSPDVLQAMYDLADAGAEEYASGDGLQVRELKFGSPFSLAEFVHLNNITNCSVQNRGGAWDWNYNQ